MIYKTGDIFHAPFGSVLVHSCNCQGVWGAGIAKSFKTWYPEAFDLYRTTCKTHIAKDILGKAQLTSSNGHIIASLFVSKRYGWAKDSEDEILNNTIQALSHLAGLINPMRLEVNMPKINSGLFGVPWEKTEKLVKLYLEPSTMGVTVWELG